MPGILLRGHLNSVQHVFAQNCTLREKESDGGREESEREREDREDTQDREK